jgi:hypothetical protein
MYGNFLTPVYKAIDKVDHAKEASYSLLILRSLGLDDLLIISESKEQHEKDVKDILEILRKANLKIKAEKCFWFRKSVKFLGLVVTTRGVHIDQQRIEKIVQSKRPKDQQGVRRFLGMVHFVDRFVRRIIRLHTPSI